MKVGGQIALSNQGGNTMVEINKAEDELNDQAMIVHMSINIH